MDPCQELRNIVMSFRVLELQMLLGFAQRNKSGNKTELQNRALTLLNNPQHSIAAKIRELQRASLPKPAKRNQTIMGLNYRQDETNPPHLMRDPSGFTPETLTNIMESFANYMTNSTNPALNNYPILPDVRFKPLPFCEEMNELLKPSSLAPASNARMQMAHFEFHLTPQQIADIVSNRSLNEHKYEYGVQVQVRFGLMETTCEQTDLYPPHLAVRINNRLCQLPIPATNQRPNVETKVNARPVDVTSSVRLNPTASNTVSIEWASDFGRAYAVRISLVRKLTSIDLLRRLRVRGYKPSDYTRGLIKEKLALDEDTEISCSSWRVSVACPLTKSRMLEPCRPARCRHLQCFDAAAYIKMNECKSRWLCPVCDKPAPFDELFLDGYFAELLKSRFLTESNELIIDRDGTWHQKSDVRKNNDQDGAEVLILDDTDPCIDVKIKPETQSILESNTRITSTGETVDLTLSDSEDEDVPLSVLAQSLRTENTETLRPKEVCRTSSDDSVVMLLD